MSTENTKVAVAVARAGVLAEVAAGAMLKHVHHAIVVEVPRGKPLPPSVGEKGTVVVMGTYYDQKDLLLVSSKSSALHVWGFAEDIVGKYKIDGIHIKPIVSERMSYPRAIWEEYCAKTPTPPTLQLIDDMSRGKSRNGTQWMYVMYGDRLAEGAAHVLFDAKFDEKTALALGGYFAMKADSVLDCLIKGAGRYAVVLPESDWRAASIDKKRADEPVSTLSLSIVNTPLDIAAVGQALVKTSDLTLVVRMSFDVGYSYTLVAKPGSGLSAVNLVKLWKCNGGGSHNDAGWTCDESFTQFLTRIGAQKAK